MAYSITVSHEGLGKSRVLTGSDQYILKAKAEALCKEWDTTWQRKVTAQTELRNKQQSTKDLLELAETRTRSALNALDAVRNLLASTRSTNGRSIWESAKRVDEYPLRRPEMAIVAEPKYVACPKQPNRADKRFNDRATAAADLIPVPVKPERDSPVFKPTLGMLESLLTSAQRKQEMVDAAYQKALAAWETQCASVAAANAARVSKQFEKMMASWVEEKRLCDEQNAQRLADFNRQVEVAKSSYESDTARYLSEESAFGAQRQDYNLRVSKQQAAYEALEPAAMNDFFELVLDTSKYPESFPREWEMDYLADSRMLIVDYTLPAPAQMPKIKEVKYLSTKEEFKEMFCSERETNALYDSALYQITLRTVHELFTADYANALDAIVFNGIVHGVDRASGHNTIACVLSLEASKDEFLAIQLANIEPKACFKMLKGVGSSQLHGLSPIAPILQIKKDDSRFVDGYNVADKLDDSTNLASMDWEDFEHLVREVFEKEFRSTGGEVRITQASRDGGVDAVAFDPDPIRGGKIVIQAKRYTNVVSVSAVRDLYGTVMNEGATKGILVTTATYGPDSYEFAKGKPLTLLNGSNLLHLLAKHGHRATIDIQAARAGQT